jgi:hypothetical protein
MSSKPAPILGALRDLSVALGHEERSLTAKDLEDDMLKLLIEATYVVGQVRADIQGNGSVQAVTPHTHAVPGGFKLPPPPPKKPVATPQPYSSNPNNPLYTSHVIKDNNSYTVGYGINNAEYPSSGFD